MKIFIALLALVGLSLGVYIYSDIASQPANVIVTTVETGLSDTVGPVNTATIIRTKDGYEPNQVVVTKGTTVVWKNDSNHYHWPASDYHPSHTEYPEFDSKRPIAHAEDWSFAFDKVGQWDFHDHLMADKKGTIYVEDPEEVAFTLEEGQILEQVVE